MGKKANRGHFHLWEKRLVSTHIKEGGDLQIVVET